MATFKKTLFSLMIITWLQVSIEAKKYMVGDLDGWTPSNIDYNAWASSKTFHPGDTLVFEYDAKLHNVMQVKADDYESCNLTAIAIATYTTGKDRITLKAKGNYYFFCGSPGHCDAGQKVEIKVVNPSSSLSSSPSPTFSPTNSKARSPASSPSSSAKSAPSPLAASSPISSTLSPPPSEGPASSSAAVPAPTIASTTVTASPPSSSGAIGVVPSKGLLIKAMFVVLPLFLGLARH